MGKNMYTKQVDDELEDINPSCMWGIILGLDYHHWRHNVKRMFPHRRNQGRRAKSHESPKKRALDHASSEMQILPHEDERASPVDQSHKDSASIKKRSIRSRIKALITDQNHKEGIDEHHGSRFSARSGLERTYSIHHLEPSDHGFDEICTDWEHPIIFFPGNENIEGSKLQDPAKSNVTGRPDEGEEKFNKSSNVAASRSKLKEHTDVLEMLKVNKELFLEILRNADDGIKKLSRTVPASKAKSRLTKSGSFPVGDLSQRKNLSPSKLKHKQSEIWSAPQREKYPVYVFNYWKNLLSRSGPSADNSSSTRVGRALSLILESTIESDKERPRDFAMPLKEKKQAFQLEGMKGKDAANSSLGEVSNREESSTREKDFAECYAEPKMNRDGDRRSCRSQKIDDIDYRNDPLSYRRSSSLYESLDKYASLFESNSGKEVRLQSSKSLRLSNENEMRSRKTAPVLFKRIRSLSQLDEFYSSLQNVIQVGGIFADWPFTSAEETSLCTKGDTQGDISKPTGLPTSTEECVAPDDTQEPKHQTEMTERMDDIQPVDKSRELEENIAGECLARMECLPKQHTFYEISSNRDQETNYSEIASENFQDETYSFGAFPSTQGLESRDDLVDEDSSINWHDGTDRASSSLLNSRPNLEKNKPNMKNDTDLDYVRDLLEHSGFTKNSFKWTWHSLDQPLSPSVFEEMETYWHQELEYSKEDLWSCYHHQLLFELVNEELTRLYDRSYTYYPKALSSSCHVPSFPVGNHLLEEILSSINSLISIKTQKIQSLDSLVDLDLKRNDGWMNQQLESEGVALELEDMIFDELLEEIVCFCSASV